MNVRHLIVLIMVTALLAVLPARPAGAWGAKAEMALVTTALHMLSKDVNLPLTRYDKELREGALLGEDQLRRMVPAMASSPTRAIESEMALLQTMRGDKIDAYFVYRLGVLGKLVARATAPMSTASAVYRNLYYADVERSFQSAALDVQKRMSVDPMSYLPPLMTAATANDATIEREYQSGLGFKGMATLSFSRDVNRSVAAVADIWFTVLSGRGVAGGVSEAQRRDYVLDAYRFYIDRGNMAELDAVAARLDTLVQPNTDLRVKIGDLYYDAGMAERAVKEYEAVVAQEPDRKDVADRIAKYYLDKGEDAMKKDRLESARDLFAKASDTNPLHPDAERLRIEADSMINARDSRQEANRAFLTQAAGLQSEAEQEALRGHYAEAMAMLDQAGQLVQQVSDEFPQESSQRERSLREIDFRMQEYRTELVNTAQRFSGAGDALDVMATAKARGRELDKQLLQSVANASFNSAMQSLESETGNPLRR